MPTGLLAALVTRLAHHLLIRRVVRRTGRSRTSRRRGPGRPGGGVDRAPAGLGGLDELEGHRDADGAGTGALGDSCAEPDGGEAVWPRPTHVGNEKCTSPTS